MYNIVYIELYTALLCAQTDGLLKNNIYIKKIISSPAEQQLASQEKLLKTEVCLTMNLPHEIK